MRFQGNQFALLLRCRAQQERELIALETHEFVQEAAEINWNNKLMPALAKDKMHICVLKDLDPGAGSVYRRLL